MSQLHKGHLLFCLFAHHRNSPLNRRNVSSGKCDTKTYSHEAENLDRKWFFFLFFFSWMADFNTLPQYFRLPSFLLSGQRKLTGIDTMNFNLFNFSIHLDFCSLGDSLCFCCAGKDLNIIENPLVTVRKSFQSCKIWIHIYGVNFQCSVCRLRSKLGDFSD